MYNKNYERLGMKDLHRRGLDFDSWFSYMYFCDVCFENDLAFELCHQCVNKGAHELHRPWLHPFTAAYSMAKMKLQ